MEEGEYPDLTIPDLSWRIRYLEARVESIRGLCLALAATHPLQDSLEKAWGVFAGRLACESLELEAMQGNSSAPSPESTSFLRSELHQIERAWAALRRQLESER